MIKHKGSSGQIALVLYKDEKLVQALTDTMMAEGIFGAALRGIGVLKNIELGYYDLHGKQYDIKKYSGKDYELLSLMGNVTLRDGKPFVHLHAVLGDEHFNTFGGHLFEAEVGVTAEIIVSPLGAAAERELREDLGLALIARFK